MIQLKRLPAAGVAGAMCLWMLGCVPPEPVAIVPAALPNGVAGQGYAAQLSLEGGGGARWRLVEGELPPGVGLDGRSGAIGGTPTQAGIYAFVVEATDASNLLRKGQAAYTLTILERLELAASLPVGRVQQAYAGSLAVSGGVPPYAFSAIGLPAGIALDPATGTISGTPIYPVTGELIAFTVTDSGTPGQAATTSAPLVIKGLPVRIATESLPDAIVGSLYSQHLQAADGVGPYTWAVVAGDLRPAGLELVLATGEIRNRRDALNRPIPIPADATDATFEVRVTDSDNPVTTATRTFTINARQPN